MSKHLLNLLPGCPHQQPQWLSILLWAHQATQLATSRLNPTLSSLAAAANSTSMTGPLLSAMSLALTAIAKILEIDKVVVEAEATTVAEVEEEVMVVVVVVITTAITGPSWTCGSASKSSSNGMGIKTLPLTRSMPLHV
jgi:hypothetical protein